MKLQMFRKYCIYVFSALVILFTGCSGSNPSSPLKTIEEISSASEEVTVNGRIYSLSTYLWRDFMPGNEESDLTAVVTISESNFLDIPSYIDVTYLWIINGDEVWASFLSSEGRAQPQPYQLEKIARGGPKWAVGTNVEAVVSVTDGSGSEYLLKVSNQMINATH